MPDEHSLVGIRPTDLPAPPQAAVEILQACANPNVRGQEVSGIVSRDPALTAELLRLANSAFFGVSREVRTIDRAVTVLGHRALRNLVLCISMQKVLRGKEIPGFDVSTYWEESLLRAVAARRLGEVRKMAPAECMTVGLLQDFGLLVMLHAMPAAGAEWQSLRRADPEERYDLEQRLFGTTHDRVGAMLSEAWSLPEEIGTPLAFHHGEPRPGAREGLETLCNIAHCADWMAAICATEAKTSTVTRCQEELQKRLQIDEERGKAILAEMAEGVEEAAAALGLRIKRQLPLAQVMQRANERLADEALSYQELTWRLEHALRERDRLAAQLNQELELAREIQQSLLPSSSDPSFPIRGLNISARAVSGDFYDFFPLEDGRIFFNLADVSGKGMNAALLMARTSSLFHCLGKKEHDVGKLMALVNEELCESPSRGMFVTMIGGLLDPTTGRIQLINAGHPPALWLQVSGGIKEFSAQGPPLGVLSGVAYSAIEFALDGGTLFMFSDGLSEWEGQGSGPLEVDGVKHLLTKLQRTPRAERLQKMVEAVNPAGRVLRDDLTLLAVDG